MTETLIKLKILNETWENFKSKTKQQNKNKNSRETIAEYDKKRKLERKES